MPNDPILTYFQSAPGPVDVERLDLDSPGLQQLRAAGVKLVVPLVAQGELIGLLNLGQRMSEQEYSADDRKLLQTLAAQAAPSVRVAQLVREQQSEIRTRERWEQEMRVAHLIQQNFLPKQAPELSGWQLSAYYRSAREVGGDFYDFIDLASGKIGLVIGDVTDKGVPAALVMAATRSVLRSAAHRYDAPGEVLARANDQMVPDMPEKMFVTCMYAVLDPATGVMRYANAGHDLPYKREAECVCELKARGMPLGLMPGMFYEEKEAVVAPGETVLLSSDGLVEAHSPTGEMFGCPRVVDLMRRHPGGSELIEFLLDCLHEFTGPEWEQEDDITMVTLRRSPDEGEGAGRRPVGEGSVDAERVLLTSEIASEPGNERIVMRQVVEAVADLGLDAGRIEKLKTAVAEATMNAIEHGNENRAELPVAVRVSVRGETLKVHIVDHGGAKPVPEQTSPDLEAKLAGEQSPRGWGLFLIRNMVDEMTVSTDGEHHTIELTVLMDGS